jgi:hypothetical protein
MTGRSLNKNPYAIRNLLFDFKHGDNDTPISPVRDFVKRFSSGDPPKVFGQHHHWRNYAISPSYIEKRITLN